MGYNARGRLSSLIGIFVILALSATIGLAIAFLSGRPVSPVGETAWQGPQATASPSASAAPQGGAVAAAPTATPRVAAPTRAATPVVLPLRANPPGPQPLPTAAVSRMPTARLPLDLVAGEALAAPAGTAVPAASAAAAQPLPATAMAPVPLSATGAVPLPTLTTPAPISPALPAAPATSLARAAPLRPPTTTDDGRVQPPELILPGPDAAGNGVVLFSWLPTASLPPATAYEVVWWFPDQDPAAATGMAAPTGETYLQVDLDLLYEAGALRSPQFYWTVLIVQPDPYVRLTVPGQSPARQFVYDTGGVPLLKP